MDDRVRKHHRATLRRIAQLDDELDRLIIRSRALVETAPESAEFAEILDAITLCDGKIRAAKQLAVRLNAMLPPPVVQLVPPARERYPTPRPLRQRRWARVMQLEARPSVHVHRLGHKTPS